MNIHLFDKSKDFVVLPAGHVIFKAGEPGDNMFAVLEGAVEISVRDHVIEIIGPGGVFGEMALVEARPRSANAIVKEQAKLVAIDRNRFLYLVQQTPFFALQMLGVVTERLLRFVENV